MTDTQLKTRLHHGERTKIVGQVRYHRELAGSRLRHPRDIIVWLPPSYGSHSPRHYPVLYMHDGQNLMDPATAFLGYDWRVDETATRLICANRMREIIIVGIYNTPDRQHEYSGSHAGRAFAGFVVHKIKPLVDKTYRTRPGRASTAVIGSSMGGLCSFLFAWWYPEVFGHAACMSGSFLWDRQKIIKEVLAYQGSKKPVRFYLDVGGKETMLIPGYRAMVSVLKGQGYRKGIDLEYHFARNGEHNEREWGRRLWRPLTFLFGIGNER